MGSSNSTTNHNSSSATLSPEPSKIKTTTPSTKKKSFIRLVRRISSQNSIPRDEFNESSTDEINDNRRINKTADIGKRIKNIEMKFKERIYYMLLSYVFF